MAVRLPNKQDTQNSAKNKNSETRTTAATSDVGHVQ